MIKKKLGWGKEEQKEGKKCVLLGVTGSIAAYKAVEIASGLVKLGLDVDVVMTEEAQKFVTALTFEAITKRRVITSLWDEDIREITHIDVAARADLMLVAPATAHVIAQMAHGLAGDALTTMALVITSPVLLAPAMNVRMWENIATRANVDLLKKRGVEFVGPEEGMLACGYEGMGRLCEVDEIIAKAAMLLELKLENEEEETDD